MPENNKLKIIDLKILTYKISKKYTIIEWLLYKKRDSL